MKKLYTIIFFALLILNNNVNSQTPNFLWAKQLGGASFDEGMSVAVDVNGSVYTTGVFLGTADFDPGPETYDLTPAGWGIYVSKLDASGNFLWAKQFTGPSNAGDLNYSITVDANGNVYTTGIFSFTVDFDPGPGVYNLSSTNGNIFVLKLDTNGNFLWVKQLAGGSYGFSYSIAVNAIGNVSTTGTFRNTADFDPGSGTYNLISAGIGDIFVSTLDASGNFLWAKKMGGTNDDIGNSIAVDPSGNVYTTGTYIGTVDFDPGPGTYNLTGFNLDIFVSKLDASGNFVWAKKLGGANNDFSNDIALDAENNVYTTGYFNGTADFDPGPGPYILSEAGGGDIFVSKLSTFGDFIWAKSFGGSGSDQGNSIAVDTNGDVYTTGMFGYTVDFDPGPGVYNLIYSSGKVFISKLDSLGNFLWAGQMGGASADGNSITVDGNVNIYITGYFNGTADFDPGNGTYNLTANSSDAFVVKLCQVATPTIAAIGSTTFCQGSSVILEASSANSYLWSNGETTQNINVTTSGNYSVTVSSASGCTAASSVVTVIVNPTPPPPNITIVDSTSFCQGGSVTLTSSSATSYLWSNGATTQSITVSTAGQYLVTIANVAGCTATSSGVTVKVNPLPTATITSSDTTTFCQGGSVTLMASAASLYSWSNGATTQSITVSTGGNYSVTITDTNGCTDASPVTAVTVNPIPTVLVNSDTICAGQSATLTVNGAATYLWSNGMTGSSINVSPDTTITYTVTGTTAGCVSAPVSTQVTVNPVPIVLVNSDTICAGQSATLTATGAATYLWSNGMTGSSITVSPTSSTTYTVTGTTVGCASVPVSAQVTTNSLPMVNLGADITITQGQQAVLNATCTCLDYLWSTGATTSTIIVDSMGIYTVTVTNSAGCSATDSILVMTTSTTNPLDKYKISISPNPTDDIILIICQGASTSSAQIIDNLGKIVSEDNTFVLDGAARTLSLEKMPSGKYYVRIVSKEFARTVSIIKH